MSVADISKDFGEFDYIICHGVISWVPPEVQEKILEVCSTHLAPDGIAYLSYNTLPGWNSVRSVRDMMLYHTARFPNAAEKAQHARSLLKFIGDAMREGKSMMAEVINNEFELISKQPDNYLLHDHLEEINNPFYFHEFMARAGKHGLQYLGDTSLDKMFSGNMSAEVAKVLETSNDIVRTEQYMDFINDRRFRNTLLCHKDRIPNRVIDPNMLREGFVGFRFVYPEGIKDHDIASGKPLALQRADGLTLTTSDPIILAMFQACYEQRPRALRMSELTALVRAKLRQAKINFTEQNEHSLEDMLCLNVMRHIFAGGFYFYAQEPFFVATVSKKPAASPLVRYQAPRQDMVTNQWQDAVKISLLDKALLPYVDGTHDVAALVKLLLPHFASGELTMKEKDGPVTDTNLVEQKTPAVVAFALQCFMPNADCW